MNLTRIKCQRQDDEEKRLIAEPNGLEEADSSVTGPNPSPANDDKNN